MTVLTTDSLEEKVFDTNAEFVKLSAAYFSDPRGVCLTSISSSQTEQKRGTNLKVSQLSRQLFMTDPPAANRISDGW